MYSKITVYNLEVCLFFCGKLCY